MIVLLFLIGSMVFIMVGEYWNHHKNWKRKEFLK
ncbi:hypothetical protein NDGK_01049 [Clostridiales bacterium CHKCI001]|nr:hypothetical protein NDGK_01049 [Clostridiales bacterium CHKCI001]